MVNELNYWSIEDIKRWLEKPNTDWADLAIVSVSLLERLTNDIVSLPSSFLNDNANIAIKLLEKIEVALGLSANSINTEIPLVYGILTTYFAEMGPYRYESSADMLSPAYKEALNIYREIRLKVIIVIRKMFSSNLFDPLRSAINAEILPIIDSLVEVFDGQDDRYAPFRVLGVMDIAEKLRFFTLRFSDEQHELVNLLLQMYDYKIIRFGTSGFRGVWQRDFTTENVHYVAQALCDFLNANNMPLYAKNLAENLAQQTIVIGYDGRRNSNHLAETIASIALENGFKVHISSKPTPTPALNFYSREVIGTANLAGLINCTASHNPPEWQGIKFNPKQGYPAPTSLTDIIASRANQYKLLNLSVPKKDISLAEEDGKLSWFDPLNLYINWLLNAGKDDNRISINVDNIRKYFSDKKIVYDPMYGSGTGYLTKIFGMLGISHVVIHDERDSDLGKQVEKIRGIPHLEYANPEPDFIQPLIDEVIGNNAVLGLGLDTDADRFGIVDKDGVYIRPNQVLAMLTRYLGIERGETGRVIITQTGLPMIDKIAGYIPNNLANTPSGNALPAYISHPFYKHRVGEQDNANFENVYVVPVGIKYIIDVMRVPENASKESAYRAQSNKDLPENWMDRLLIGGEESSGLTTKGHIPDKDGIWADLLIMDMLAHFALKYENLDTLVKIWNDTENQPFGWRTTGYRVDLDATTLAKESILNYFLDIYKDWQHGQVFPTINGLNVIYSGGTRYDFVELFLHDETNDSQHFLRVRASGTEPILRVYVESYDSETADELTEFVLGKLDQFNLDIIRHTDDASALADVISNTRFSEVTYDGLINWLLDRNYPQNDMIALLELRRPHVESRNAKLIDMWIDFLRTQGVE